MELLSEALQQEWAIRALIASAMVGIMCGVLGSFIVLRNMALIGDALAHAILPGVVLAFVVVGYSALGFFTGAVLAGLATAIGITWIQQNVKTKNDAAIGIVFTAMFSIGVVGISSISHDEGVHLDLKDFLFGNVLGVYNEDLILTACICVYLLICVYIFYRYLFVSTFQAVIAETMGISVQVIHYFLMLMLSFAVVASLQTVGVIQVVAMLITPASTALLLSNRLNKVILISALLGFASAVIGLLSSIILSTTPGPMMAIVATLFYVLAVFFAPQKGLLFKRINKYKQREKIQFEDILKQSWKLGSKDAVTFEVLREQLGFTKSNLTSQLRKLKRQGLLTWEAPNIKLTNKGIDEANRLVRAHRLWETYLVDKIGLNEAQIHEEAEKYEHLLTDALVDEVDRSLGFPETDPHGSPIPIKPGIPENPMSKMRIGKSAKIDDFQIDDKISSQLWQLGILPDQVFVLSEVEDDRFKVIIGDKEIILYRSMAERVNVEPIG